jgi:outer membrane protein, multidrug efflux system
MANLPFRRVILISGSALGLSLSGCALQPPAATHLSESQSSWSSSYAPTQTQLYGDSPSSAAPVWWAALNDQAIDTLVTAAQASSPTLALAIARIDEAQAALGSAKAAAAPKVNGNFSASRGDSKSLTASTQSDASANVSLSWDIDLFGRLRHTRAASEQRLMSKEADARSTRLALQAQVVDTALSSKACYLQLASQLDDARSLKQTLEITRRRLAVGAISATDTARVDASLADSSGLLSKTQSLCLQFSHALVNLTGLSMSEVQAVLTLHDPQTSEPIPQAPELGFALPASVLAHHPNVVAALRAADAAYEDMGRDKAARMPSIGLTTLLGSNWLSLAGSFARSSAWSLGLSASAALFDGGAGQAQVKLAEVRYNQSVAQLESIVRATAQDIENALTQQASTLQRRATSNQSLEAQRIVFNSRLASLRLGHISRQDFEEAHRALNAAVYNQIGAQRDHAQAWVSLIKASGNSLIFSSDSQP